MTSRNYVDVAGVVKLLHSNDTRFNCVVYYNANDNKIGEMH